MCIGHFTARDILAKKELIINPPPTLPPPTHPTQPVAPDLPIKEEKLRDKDSPKSSIPSKSISHPAHQNSASFPQDYRYASCNNGSNFSSNQFPSLDSNYPYGSNNMSFIDSSSSNTPGWAANACQSNSWDGQGSQGSPWETPSNQFDTPKKQSPVRESLDSRIEFLLKRQHIGIAPSFLEVGAISGLGNPPFKSKDFQPSADFSRAFEGISLSNDQDDDSQSEGDTKQDGIDAIIGTPPSPFLSGAEYIRWHEVTQAIDSGKEINLESDEDEDDIDEDGKEPINGEWGDGTPVKDEVHNVKRKRPKNKNPPPADVNNDDDRMSLSSLSSDEFAITTDTSGIVHHPMFPNEQIQMACRMELWKPGSTLFSMPPPTNGQQSFLGPYPQFPLSYPLTHNASLTGNFSQTNFTSHPAYQSAQLFTSYPVSGFLAPNSHFGPQQTMDQALEASKGPLTEAVLAKVVSELKEIIKRDISKKMIEHAAFKIYENWWDEQEKNSKKSDSLVDEKPIKTEKPTELSTAKLAGLDSSWSVISALYDKDKEENSFKNYREGASLGLGLRAVLPKMPSFRKKYKKPSTPPDDEDTRFKDEDDDDWNRSPNHLYKNGNVNNFKRNRAAAVIEDEVSQSSSDESESSHIKSRRRRRRDRTRASSLSSSSSSNSSSGESQHLFKFLKKVLNF